MSKAGRPRPRYIACNVEAPRPVGRKALQNALTGRARKAGIADDLLPKVTRYEQPHLIVWSDHRVARQVRDVLGGMTWAIEAGDKVPLRIETLDSSGTIRRLTRRTGVLQERGPKRADTPSPSKKKAGQQAGPPANRAPGRPAHRRS